MGTPVDVLSVDPGAIEFADTAMHVARVTNTNQLPGGSNPEYFERIRTALAGRYTLEREIGRGGMGAVYLARDTRHGRDVAVKVLPPELSSSLGAERFLREIRTSAQLLHPNIIALIDSGDADGLLYYIMPHVRGETLRDKLDRQSRLPVDEAVRITREVSSALEHAHKQGIIHRDIKPENILLVEGTHACVADFGLARAVTPAANLQLTATGLVVGSPYYISPEQAVGGQDVDGRTDIFSLGCVLFEMLAGERPFQGDSVQALITRRIVADAPSLRTIRADIPRTLDQIVQRMLQREPAARYSSAAELTRALDAIHEGGGGRSSGGFMAPPERRRLLIHVAVIAVSVLSLVGVWLVVSGGGGPSPARADPAHIAVLAFRPMGGGEDIAAFATDLQTRLIDGLGAASAGGGQTGSKRLRVVSRAGMAAFAHGAVPLDSIQRALDVGTVLEGTVEPTDSGMKVHVRLVDAETGDQLGSSIAESRGADRVALLNAVADSVVRLIRKGLGPIVRERMRFLETRNPAAFDRFVSAKQRLGEFEPAFRRKEYKTAQHVLDDADSLLAQAERFDPRWIEPKIERGRMTRQRVRLAVARGDEDATAEIANGLRHAERAIKVLPDDHRGLELRGEVRLLQWERLQGTSTTREKQIIEAAEHDLRAALVANPTPARALRILSELAGVSGHTEEALDYGKRAYEEDPYLEEVDNTVFRMFEFSFALGRDQEAAKWCAEGRARFAEPIFEDCRLALAAWSDAYPLTPDSAWAVVAAELVPYPAPFKPRLEPRLHAMVAAVLARSNMPDSALALVRSAQARDRTIGVLKSAAGVYGLLSMPDSSLALVREVLAEIPSQRGLLDRSPELRSIRADPRFRKLVVP